jgi:hypothetical protein
MGEVTQAPLTCLFEELVVWYCFSYAQEALLVAEVDDFLEKRVFEAVELFFEAEFSNEHSDLHLVAALACLVGAAC